MTESVMVAESFLRLKGRTTYFRRKIPGDLVSRLASTEICFRLGVIDRDSAVHLGRRLAVAVDAFFVSARRDKMLSSPDLTALLGAALADWRTSVSPVPVPLVSTREQATTMASMADGMLRQQGDGIAVVDEQFIIETFAAAGIAAPQDPVTLRLAGNVLAAGMAAHYLDTPQRWLARMAWTEDSASCPRTCGRRAARLVAPYGELDAPPRTEVRPAA